jgi:hypothetical protein
MGRDDAHRRRRQLAGDVMSTKRDDDWLELKGFADVIFYVEEPPPETTTTLRWKLRADPSPWDLTFRIEIKNDRETK